MYTYVIIDDEELIRKGTIKKLAPMSEEITCIGEADNGLTGIELVKTYHPDFVILDMQMPEMDGMALLPWLSSNYPSLPLIVISGYRDFDYIKQAISSNAIEYILKPFSREMIQDSVRQAIERLSNRSHMENRLKDSEQAKEQACYDFDIQLISNLILGNHVASTSLTSQKLSFINGTHHLLLLTMHFTQPINDNTVQNWLEEHGFADLALYLSGPQSPNLGSMILFIPENSTVPKEKLTTEILDVFIPWAEEQSSQVIVGISQAHRDINDLAAAYDETSQALNQQPVSRNFSDRYVYTGEIEPRLLEWDLTEEFLFRIDSGMADEVDRLTHELFDWYRSLGQCSLADAKLHCHMLADQCRLILNAYLNNQKAKESSGSMQNIIRHLFTLQELQDYYLQFFTNLASMIEPLTVYAVDDIIEKIQIYMERNYQKNLTQELISSLFCLNRSYLSTLFKSKTGKKFVDYLNEIRIRHSQEMLTQTDRKMYSIARAVGYDNVKYYFRVFKKHTGLTPEQYRQKYS